MEQVRNFLVSLPHPTWTELLVSMQLFVLLWAPKKILDKFGDDAISRARNRRVAVRNHVYADHPDKLKSCTVDDCALLSAVLTH